MLKIMGKNLTKLKTSLKSLPVLAYLILFFLISGTLIPHQVKAEDSATLYLSPASGSFFVGDTFSVGIFANTGGNSINAVDVKLRFPADKLQIVNPTLGESFISIWVSQPEYSNTNGSLDLAGIIPNPGINTKSGLITSVVFRVKQPGEATIYFDKSSQILKNDGLGTNLLDTFVNGKYNLIVPPPEGPIVTSISHPDKNRWYSNPNPEFSWTKDEDVVDFSYNLDKNPQGVPDEESEGASTTKKYTNVPDGVWFFNIKAKKTSWGGTTHFPVLIDTTPPASFPINIDPPQLSDVDKGLVSFLTTDNASGVGHYEIMVEGIDDSAQSTPIFIEATSPYRMSPLKEGKYQITVRAFDNTGNFRDVKKEITVTRATLIEKLLYDRLGLWILSTFLLFIIILLIVIMLIRKIQRKDKSRKAKEELGKVFDALEADLLEELRKLELIKTQRELTEQEQEFRMRIIKDLQISEDDLKEYFDEYEPPKEKEEW